MSIQLVYVIRIDEIVQSLEVTLVIAATVFCVLCLGNLCPVGPTCRADTVGKIERCVDN